MKTVDCQLEEINRLLAILQKEPFDPALSDIRVKTRIKNNKAQYYLKKSGEKKDKYVPQKERETVRIILQITPVIDSDQVFIDKWYRKYRTEEKNGFEENLKFPTDRGELVRSKSEKILADLFAKNEIPYVYEPAVQLDKSRHVFPDFVLLNIRTRKTYLWEHLGLVDDGEYASKNLKKIAQYEKCGYIIGENLIITMESTDLPMDLKSINDKIKRYFE